jgi:hypothetical protein
MRDYKIIANSSPLIVVKPDRSIRKKFLGTSAERKTAGQNGAMNSDQSSERMSSSPMISMVISMVISM